MTVPEVLAEVIKDQVFFDESGGGVTVSGGEPLLQAGFVEALLAACKTRRIRTVLDTCGFADSGVLRRVSEHVDLLRFEVDGQRKTPAIHRCEE
jgi:pyruvate formate lyase activating enzyme